MTPVLLRRALQGYNDVSWHNKGTGRGWTRTPNMDALSARGVRLEEYITNPICSPSRATIMTGRYTIRTGIQNGCYAANQVARRTKAEHAVASLKTQHPHTARTASGFVPPPTRARACRFGRSPSPTN